MSALVRTRRGTMIHASDCRLAQSAAAVPWNWADEVPEVEVFNAIATFGYLRCSRCKPLSHMWAREI